jgi:hypothetical protein
METAKPISEIRRLRDSLANAIFGTAHNDCEGISIYIVCTVCGESAELDEDVGDCGAIKNFPANRWRQLEYGQWVCCNDCEVKFNRLQGGLI